MIVFVNVSELFGKETALDLLEENDAKAGFMGLLTSFCSSTPLSLTCSGSCPLELLTPTDVLRPDCISLDM